MFPPDKDGIQAAIDSTPLMGSWESKIDWAMEVPKPESIPIDTLTPTVYVLGQLAAEHPELFSERDHALIEGWLGAVIKHMKEENNE